MRLLRTGARCRLLVQVILPPTGLALRQNPYTHARFLSLMSHKPSSARLKALWFNFRFARHLGVSSAQSGHTAVTSAQPDSEQELQRELHLARIACCQDLVERWRTDVAVRQAEIRMIQDIEQLRPEL